MIETSSHIINKMTIDIQVNSVELANEVKENSDEWVRDVLSKELLNYFSKLETKLDGRVIQLESLNLEIDVDSLQDNPKLLADQFIRQLDDSFSSLISEVLIELPASSLQFNRGLNLKNPERFQGEKSRRVQNSDQRTIQSFIYFLDTGQLPWWVKSNAELTLMFEERNLSAAIRENASEITKELRTRTKNISFLRRLIGQFSNSLIEELVLVLVSELHGRITNVETTKRFFSELIDIEPSKKVQIVSLLVNSIYLRHEVTLSSFESKLFAQLSQNPQSIFASTEVNGVKIFELVALISVLSDGSVANYSSKGNVQREIALNISDKLDLVQLASIANSTNASKLDNEALMTFKNHLLVSAERLSKTSKEQDLIADSSIDEIANGKEEKLDSKTQSELISESEKSEEGLVNNELENLKQWESKEFEDNGEIEAREKSTLESSGDVGDKAQKTQKEDSEIEMNLDSNSSKTKADKDDKRHTDDEVERIESKSKENSETVEDVNPNKSVKSAEEFKKEKIAEQNREYKEFNDQKQKDLTSSIEESNSEDSSNEEKSVGELLNGISEETYDSLKKKVVGVNENSFLAENGGLVLLNPFLGSLFKNLELLDEKNVIIDIDRAVCLLHYLATGSEQVFEHHLTFEKFLCGIPLKTVISREVLLTDDEKDKADNVLKSVCEYWKKMNTSSIGLLRNEFLGRKCKVDRSGDSDRIKVERKSFDVLLDSLPWSVNIIKLPWKKELIFVEW